MSHKCPKCGDAGWVWGRELDDASEETINDTMTKYSCDGIVCVLRRELTAEHAAREKAEMNLACICDCINVFAREHGQAEASGVELLRVCGKVAKCLWCGITIEPMSGESWDTYKTHWRAHVVHCWQNPVVIRAEKAEATCTDYRLFIDRLQAACMEYRVFIRTESRCNFRGATGKHDPKWCDKCIILEKANPGQPLLDRLAKLEAAMKDALALLSDCRHDIFQTARVNQGNIDGRDLCCPDDAPCTAWIGKHHVHQAGVDDSLRLVQRITEFTTVQAAKEKP